MQVDEPTGARDSSSDLPESKECASNPSSHTTSLPQLLPQKRTHCNSTCVIPHTRSKRKGKCDSLERRIHVYS